ncbi:MAG: serine proteinase [Clostridiales bacterium]|nr:serine proteinase [Clostridiales bacterium]
MAFNVNVDELMKKAAALGQSGMNLVQAGVDQGIQLANVAKLRAANVKEDSNLRAAYAELGKMYFDDHGAEPEEAYAAVCTQIANIQAAIAANNAKIAETKVAPEAEVEVEVEPEADAEVETEATAAPEEAPADEAPAADDTAD